MGNCIQILTTSNQDKEPAVEKGGSSGGHNGVNKIPMPRQYTYSELMTATQNFRQNLKLGEGGFGKVYKGQLHGVTYAPSKNVGNRVAIKKLTPGSVQGLTEWQAEINILGKYNHVNLVKLLGYCSEANDLLLVYEYMQKGSFENHLFRRAGAIPMPWETRMSIVLGAARGLAFLHNEKQTVIYRDFKTENILLDADNNAKLSDFWLAKFGPEHGLSHVSTQPMGTLGYADPEYVSTGHLYIKSDVYSFGVVLLETITGERSLDKTRISSHYSLVQWCKPLLLDKRVIGIVDRNLDGKYPKKGLHMAARLNLKMHRSEAG